MNRAVTVHAFETRFGIFVPVPGQAKYHIRVPEYIARIPCEHCGSKAGVPCYSTQSGAYVTRVHNTRKRAAENDNKSQKVDVYAEDPEFGEELMDFPIIEVN